MVAMMNMFAHAKMRLYISRWINYDYGYTVKFSGLPLDGLFTELLCNLEGHLYCTHV